MPAPNLNFLVGSLSGAWALMLAALCAADSPVAVYCFPAGGQRGTNVEFRLGGYDLHEGCPLEMAGPGLKPSERVTRAERTVWFEGPVIPLPDSQAQESYPRDCIGQVAIAADAPLGGRRLRVRNSQGVSNWLRFVVGDLPEVVEQEIDGAPLAVAVQLPVTINGRMFPREDIDLWTFQARSGTTYTCEVMAERLGSPLDSHLQILDPQGKLIADNVDYFGKDALLRFTASQDGPHQVRIHDENFGGLQHYVYRLTITDGPYVESIFPLGGQLGTSVAFELTGQNLAQKNVQQKLPEHPSDDTGTVWSSDLPSLSTICNRLPLQGSPFAEFVEVETEAAAESLAVKELVTWPTVLNGRIEAAGDIDAWRFQGAKGDSIELDVHAARLGSRLDSVLSVHDLQGKELMANDDSEKGQTDSRLVFRLPADGVYELRIRDQFANRGGHNFGYRLWMQPSSTTPDYELQVAQDVINVPRGADLKLKVKAIRKNGLSGPITLASEGLPAGVTVTGNVIAEKKNEVDLVFHADAAAPLQGGELRIVGTWCHDQQVITREVKSTKSAAGDGAAERLTIAIAVPTPFKIFGQFETKYAARGSTFVRHFSINRGGFTGPITVSLAERQVRHLQGVTGPTLIVPENVSEFDYPLHLAPWMEIGRTSRTCLMGVGEVKDPDGTVHKVSFTSGEQFDQIIVLVDPGQLDVRLNRSSVQAMAGSEVEVGVHIGRGNGVSGPVDVMLVTPEHIHCVQALPLRIAADQSSGTLKLRFAEGQLEHLNMPLTIRASAKVNGLAYTAEEPIVLVHKSDGQ